MCVHSHVRLFCDPMGYSKPDSSVHGIFQARILEWKLPFPPLRSLSHSGIEPESPALAGRFFTTVSPGKLRQYHYCLANEQTGSGRFRILLREVSWLALHNWKWSQGSSSSLFQGATLCRLCLQVSFRDCPVNCRTALTTGAFDLRDGGGKRVGVKGLFTG